MKDFIKNFDENKLKEAFKIKEAYSKGEIPLDFANAQMKAHVGSLSPAELAYIEQHFEEQVDEECIKEDLEEMLAIYEGVLLEEVESLAEGHPIKNYMDENREIKRVLKDIEELFDRDYIKNQWDEKFDQLNEFKVHLSRKQNQLYSELEKKGFDRPTTTMWLFDNEVRDRISSLREAISKDFDYEPVKEEFLDFKAYILDLMDKEENILFPTSLELLDDQIFRDMVEGDKEIGYCLISPKDDFSKRLKTENELTDTPAGDFEEDLLKLLAKHKMNTNWTEDSPMDVKQGILSLKQINLLFQHLPVDLSYVDENDLVAFYSDTKHRVFPRSKGVIGRHVKNCHPSNSVAIVEEIIDKFRSGQEDKVEFWINKPGIFIYIIYIAVRDEAGNFKGVLEMMQDCSHIRSLEGSKTLLDWENVREESPIRELNSDLDKILVLKEDTRLESLFNQYPGLKEYMIAKSDKFSMLNSSMAKFMIKAATVKMVSEKTGISMEKLQSEFELYLKELE